MTRNICPPDHKHGQTSTCYVYHKCGCEECRTGNTARQRKRREKRKQPRDPLTEMMLTEIERPASNEWRAKAACAGLDTEAFYSTDTADIRLARRVCRPCPVRTECLADALRMGDGWGVRGGMTAEQREKLNLGARPSCGTPGGYQIHLRAGEQTCVRCRRAWAASRLEYRRRVAERKARKVAAS